MNFILFLLKKEIIKNKLSVISINTLIKVEKTTPRTPNSLTKGKRSTILNREEMTVEIKFFLLSSYIFNKAIIGVSI